MAVNEFLPFATMSTANVVAQADYALDPSTGNGFSAGIALSAKLNKVWRQASFVGAGLAQFMMERTNADVVDDGDLDKFVQQLYDSFVVTLTGTGDTRWVNITGDTMTGPLVLSADPINILDAVTKQYVDNGFTYIGGIFGAYLPLAGGVLTGPLTLNANPTQPLQPATKAYVDQVFSGSGTALDPRYVNIAGDTMQGYLNVIDPVAGTSATPRSYVDNLFWYLADQFQWYVRIEGGQMYGPLYLYSNSPTQGNEAVTRDYVTSYVAGQITGGVAYLPLTGGSLEGPGNLVTRGWLIVDSGAYFRPTAFPGFSQSVIVEGTASINSLSTNGLTNWGDVWIQGHLHCETYLASRGLYVTGDLIPGFGYSLMVDGPAYYPNRIDVAALNSSGVHTAGAGVNVVGTFPGSVYCLVTDQQVYFRTTAEFAGYVAMYSDVNVHLSLAVQRNLAVGGGAWIGGVYPGLNYAFVVDGATSINTNLDVGQNFSVYGTGRSSFNSLANFGAGVWIGGKYAGYDYTLMVSGITEFQLDVHAKNNLYCWGNMTANSMAVVGLVTCNAFNVLGNDSTIGGNLYVGNICTVANALSSPTLLASSQVWAGTNINTTAYYLNGILFAAHGGSVLYIQDPGGHNTLVCYGGNSTNYYSNAVHQWVDYGYTVTYALFNGNGTYNNTGSWLPLSNRELKRDIADYDRGLEALRKLRPVSFIYNENMPLGDDQGRTRYGLIAEDVEEIIPEMTQADTINGQDIMAVATGHLVFVLTNAVKTLADKCDELERRLNDDTRATERTQRPRSGK